MDHACIRYASTEAEVEHFELVETLGDVFERQIRELLAVLQGQLLQGQASFRGAASHPGYVPDAHVRHMPAAAQVEALEFVQPPGDQQQARVGDVAASPQVKRLQVFEVLRNSAQAGVSDLFAQAEVEEPQGRDVLHKGMSETIVRQVEASTEVKAFDVRHSLDDITQTSPQTENLNFFDPPGLQAGEQRRVRSTQVELGFHPPPHRLVVGRVSPGRAHLGHSPFVFNVQITENNGQNFREKARDVGLNFKHGCRLRPLSRRDSLRATARFFWLRKTSPLKLLPGPATLASR